MVLVIKVDRHYMDIQPINGGVSGSAAAALAPEYVHLAYETSAASPSKVALVEAQAKAMETVEELADDGDALASDQLAKEHRDQVPIDAQRLQPSSVHHAPGAHEPGKGGLIDIYD